MVNALFLSTFTGFATSQLQLGHLANNYTPTRFLNVCCDGYFLAIFISITQQFDRLSIFTH
jgi:hypothetical protein